MSIRPAKIADLPSIVALGKQLHASSSYARYAFDAAKVEAALRLFIDGMGVVYVAERDGKIVGGIAGSVTEFWFGPDLHGFDYSFYVAPAHRNGTTAVRLLLSLEQWCRMQGAVEMRIGITTGIDVEATTRFYEFHGYRNNGVLFTKELPRGN